MDNTWKQQCNFEHLGVLVLGNGNPICAYCGTPFKNEKESKPIQDWEIFSLIGKESKSIYYNRNGMWLDSRNNGFPHDCSKGMEGSGCEIHSVRRIIDSKLFSVKDVTNYGIIQEFYIGYDGWMNVHFTDGNGATLNSIEHEIKPKVKLITEDGIKIFEGMTWHEVDENYLWSECNNLTMEQGVKYFSTKGKAKEYILNNKPIQAVYKELSEYMSNGIRPLYYTTVIDSVNNILKDFFKSKINNT